MDIKDRKILAELVSNSRIPINQLAKKCGISREVANYRIKRLKAERIITDFYTIINFRELGFTKYSCFFQLKNVNIDKEKEFINFLVKNDFTAYLGIALGKWNVVFDLYAKNKEHLEKIIKQIVKEKEELIDSYMIIESSSEQFSFPSKIIGVNKPIIETKKAQKSKIDETDLKIMSMLSSNSQLEYKELANKLNLAANTIKYRIKSLEKAGIILGYSISIDAQKLGYEWHNIQIKFAKLDVEKQLIHFLKNAMNVVWIYKYIGNENWDLDIGVIAKNSSELRTFIIELKNNFSDSLKIYDFFTNLEVYKGDFAPAGIFNSS